MRTAMGLVPARETSRTATEFDDERLRLSDRLVRRGMGMPGWLAVPFFAAVLGFCWAVVYASGGTKAALPHVFYVPIIGAALLFGLRGAVPAALVAAILCGPFLPVDTITGEPQQLTSWLLRGAMFLMVGGVVCWALALRERLYGSHVSTELIQAIAPSAPERPSADPSLAALIPGILERRAFHPVFQPIYAVPDGRLLAVEALTRFETDPYRTPDLWFAAAADVGRGIELELAVIRTALEAVTSLPAQISISVNASPETLADARFVELVRPIERAVIVEITEHAVITDYDFLKAHIAILREAGVMTAVDDAGAGFSSLQHIVQLAPDIIKLDISLTQELEGSPVRRALGAALVQFARSTGSLLVAEGIEEETDLLLWSALGVDAVQGYLTGRPDALPVNLRSDAIHRLYCQRQPAR